MKKRAGVPGLRMRIPRVMGPDDYGLICVVCELGDDPAREGTALWATVQPDTTVALVAAEGVTPCEHVEAFLASEHGKWELARQLYVDPPATDEVFHVSADGVPVLAVFSVSGLVRRGAA